MGTADRSDAAPAGSRSGAARGEGATFEGALAGRNAKHRAPRCRELLGRDFRAGCPAKGWCRDDQTPDLPLLNGHEEHGIEARHSYVHHGECAVSIGDGGSASQRNVGRRFTLPAVAAARRGPSASQGRNVQAGQRAGTKRSWRRGPVGASTSDMCRFVSGGAGAAAGLDAVCYATVRKAGPLAVPGERMGPGARAARSPVHSRPAHDTGRPPRAGPTQADRSGARRRRACPRRRRAPGGRSHRRDPPRPGGLPGERSRWRWTR